MNLELYGENNRNKRESNDGVQDESLVNRK
jgi:hypothetical protein